MHGTDTISSVFHVFSPSISPFRSSRPCPGEFSMKRRSCDLPMRSNTKPIIPPRPFVFSKTSSKLTKTNSNAGCRTSKGLVSICRLQRTQDSSRSRARICVTPLLISRNSESHWVIEPFVQPPCRYTQILRMDDPDAPPVSDKWLTRWIKSHPQFKVIRDRPIKTARADAMNAHNIRQWFSVPETTL